MKEQVVSATEFKAKCLGYLDKIEQRGKSIMITRRGKPVAVLAPVKRKARKSPANSWAGRMEIIGDIVDYDTSELWDALKPE